MIQSSDEEDKEEGEDLPEGFWLQADSMHCINIRKADEFKAYVNQICSNLFPMVKQGRDVEEEYRKVVCIIYWACKAVRNSSLIGDTDPECIAGSVRDLNCVAWRQKLLGKDEAIPKELLIDEEEDSQVAIETKEIEETEIGGYRQTTGRQEKGVVTSHSGDHYIKRICS